MKYQDTIIVHPSSEAEANEIKAFLDAQHIKFEQPNEKEKPYDPAFVKKIERSMQDAREGKGKVYTMEELNALWK